MTDLEELSFLNMDSLDTDMLDSVRLSGRRSFFIAGAPNSSTTLAQSNYMNYYSVVSFVEDSKFPRLHVLSLRGCMDATGAAALVGNPVEDLAGEHPFVYGLLGFCASKQIPEVRFRNSLLHHHPDAECVFTRSDGGERSAHLLSR